MPFLILLLFFMGCTNPPYRGCDVCGPDDFVIDSYQIQEGKLAILKMEGKCVEDFDCTLLEEYEDVIQEGDILQVVIYHPTRVDKVAAVSAVGQSVGYKVVDNHLYLPDLPPIAVKGCTLLQAKKAMEESYASHIKDIEVFLSYRDRRFAKVELLGLVSQPTMLADGKMRLFEMLSLAQIAPNANLFKSYVTREGCLLPIDLYKLVKEGDMCQNIVMRGGDKIYIAEPSASALMVLGEVNRQRVIELPNGFMTLPQALAEAGGMPISADKRYIQVIRGNFIHPKIYTLNWQHIIRLPSDSLLLIPGDIVYVAATPIAEWDRFVNQILPTIVGIDLILRKAKNVGIIVP